MKSLPLSEAKNRFSEVIDWVEKGLEVAVTRRGVAIAKVVRIDSDQGQQERVRSAFAAIDALPRFELEGELKTIAREGLA